MQDKKISQYRFRNSGTEPMRVVVELWADQIFVPTGSTLVLFCEDTHAPPTIEMIDDGIAFYPECSIYSAEIDGTPVDV